MERCSCCNARLNGALCCPRCQADLTEVISSEQRGQQLLEQSMQLWFGHEPMLAIQSLSKALPYKKTPAALIFRDFMLRQSCSKTLALLAQGNYLEARQTLALLSGLDPTHQLVRQLQGFSQYLLSRQDSPVKGAFKNKPFMISFASRERLKPTLPQPAQDEALSAGPHPALQDEQAFETLTAGSPPLNPPQDPPTPFKANEVLRKIWKIFS
jgi:hypothetical protein